MANQATGNPQVESEPDTVGSIVNGPRRKKIEGLLDPMNPANFVHRNTEWREDALCKDHPTLDLDDFFQVSVTRKNANTFLAIKNLCRSCPVASQCLYEALLFNYDGCWAGFTHKQRTAYIRHCRDNTVVDLTVDECTEILRELHADTGDAVVVSRPRTQSA